MAKQDWVTTTVLQGILDEHRRRNLDVKIWVHGEAVPVAEVSYDRNVDAIVLVPDREASDYQTATSFCPDDEDRRPGPEGVSLEVGVRFVEARLRVLAEDVVNGGRTVRTVYLGFADPAADGERLYGTALMAAGGMGMVEELGVYDDRERALQQHALHVARFAG